MKKIPLTRGEYALVSNRDFKELNQHKWALAYTDTKTGRIYYAYRKITGNTTVRMHRQIMGLTLGDPRLVDHRDRDGLNNQRGNLRITDKSNNAANSILRSDNTTGFKGVSRFRNKFMAKVQHRGKQINLGLFDTTKQAAEAYDAGARNLFGHFARTNS